MPRVPVEDELCLGCALCCNGAIFADVKLGPGDNSTELERAGLQFTGQRLPQPCAALDGNRCRVYALRPGHCRKFECHLLQNVKAGRLSPMAALKVVREARRRLKKVEGLLRKLEETGESLPLRARFVRVTAKLQGADQDRQTTRLYGDLTLAMHELNLLLGEAFYPDSSRRASD